MFTVSHCSCKAGVIYIHVDNILAVQTHTAIREHIDKISAIKMLLEFDLPSVINNIYSLRRFEIKHTIVHFFINYLIRKIDTCYLTKIVEHYHHA